ncbi:MAG: hypothetical protein KatS3mg033_2288 [Thermonema sp.]|nr:MAG: hypothetical protein KatS3mg033_2288 [Thermonema sp.]
MTVKQECTSILNNAYAEIFYHTEADCIVLRFKLASAQMSDADFQNVMLTYAQWIEKQQISKLLLDNRELRYIVVPEMQEWITQKVAPRTLSLRYVANVVSEDIFAEVSAEQSIEESQKIRPLETNYFRSTQEAIDWLKQCQ